MDHSAAPFSRFAAASAALGVIYWALVAHPPPRAPGSEAVTTEQVHSLLDRSAALLAAGRYRESQELFLRLYRADPGNHIYLRNLAAISAKLNRPDEEVRYWEEFFNSAPLPVEACPQIGRAYEKLGKNQDALKAFERCLAEDPANTDSIFFLARALEHASDFKRALELYRRGVQLAPDYLDLRIGIARSYLHLGQLKESEELSAQVLRHSPGNTDALLVAGLASMRSGDRKTARLYLEKGLASSSDPEFREALAVMDRSERP